MRTLDPGTSLCRTPKLEANARREKMGFALSFAISDRNFLLRQARRQPTGFRAPTTQQTQPPEAAARLHIHAVDPAYDADPGGRSVSARTARIRSCRSPVPSGMAEKFTPTRTSSETEVRHVAMFGCDRATVTTSAPSRVGYAQPTERLGSASTPIFAAARLTANYRGATQIAGPLSPRCAEFLVDITYKQLCHG
jgi:hypothetical protein